VQRLTQNLNVAYRVLILELMGGSLASLLLLRHPGASVEFLNHTLFSWQFRKGWGLKVRQFHDMFPSTPRWTEITLLPADPGYLDMVDAHYTKDLVYIALLARVLSPKVVFEIGTFQGHSALLLALNTGSDAKVYTLDLPKDSKVHSQLATTVVDEAHIRRHRSFDDYLYQQHELGQKVNQLYGDSASFDFSDWVGNVDLLFIDGAHSYDYVRSDTLNALKCCHSGRVIMWHDYGRWGVNGVSQWLHAFSRQQEVYRLPGSSLAVAKIS
jgi:predicted O-methyltransferase YrrM